MNLEDQLLISAGAGHIYCTQLIIAVMCCSISPLHIHNFQAGILRGSCVLVLSQQGDVWPTQCLHHVPPVWQVLWLLEPQLCLYHCSSQSLVWQPCHGFLLHLHGSLGWVLLCKLTVTFDAWTHHRIAKCCHIEHDPCGFWKLAILRRPGRDVCVETGESNINVNNKLWNKWVV